MKTITLVSMYYPPDKNGMAVYAQKLYRFLVSHNWEVKLITRRAFAREKAKIFQVNTPSIKLNEWKKKQIARDPRTYSLKFSRGVYNLLTPREKIVHYLTCWDDYLLLYSAIARGLVGKARLIVTIGGGGERCPETLVSYRVRILNKADLITVFSKQIKENLIEIGIPSKKIIFTPPAVDLKKFSFRKARKRKILRVLYLGRIDKRKGIFDFLKVAELLKSERFEFCLVGEGLDKTQLKKKIETLKLKNINVLKGIEHKDAPRVFQQSDIFLHPTYDDEFPVSLLEALACGLPCVSTPIGEIPNIIKNNENGFLVSPGDIKAIKRGLLVLKNFKTRSEFGMKGRKISEVYSEDKILPRLLKMYRL